MSLNLFYLFEKYKTTIFILLILEVVITFFILFKKYSDYQTKLELNLENLKPIEVEKVKKRESSLEKINQLEKYFKSLNIELETLKKSKEIVSINFKTNFEKFEGIIKKIESEKSYFKILNLTVLNKEEEILNITMDLKVLKELSFYKNENLSFKNPFYKNIVKVDNKKRETVLIKVDAIVDKKVLINNKWYKENDFLKHIKILEIKKDRIKVFENNHTKEVKL